MSTQQGSPMDNLTYDLVTALSSKLEGLEAYQKYLQDAQSDQQCKQLFEQLLRDDRRHAEQLRQELTRHLSR